MPKQLFIINCGLCDEDDGLMCSKFYNDLEMAKNELKNIYNKTIDYTPLNNSNRIVTDSNIHIYTFFTYRITVYQLVEKEYVMTNKYYTYKFDKFIEYN